MEERNPTVPETLITVATHFTAFFGVAAMIAFAPGVLLAVVLIWLAIRLSNDSQRFPKLPPDPP